MRPGFTPSTGTTGAPKPKVPPAQFFVDNKKGEVNELKTLLKNSVTDKDDKKRREIVKKVIAFMTLGIDVSRLFTEMCMASATQDLVQKKMIYLYLSTYAESNPDTVIMAINTYLKDCKHAEGKIRGLALRSLCSLRFSGASEYLQPAILEALKDLDGYVRKTAIMGCVKIFYMNPSLIRNSNIVDTLYSLIRDSDPMVATNAIIALNELLFEEGGIAINNKMIVYLLNKIKEFNEWGQTIILELVARYQPRSENELFDILNLLEDRLKHSTSCIVLATIKIFLNYTVDNPKILRHVFERIQSPLLTLMSASEVSASFEITYIVLSHIQFIVSRGGAEYFEKDYKQFYCKADEPTYIKYLKVDILSIVANENNLGDILNELQEYVTDIDTELSRRSIRAIGAIGIRISSVVSAIIKQLASFLGIQCDYITNETMIAFMNIIRKYRHEYKEIIGVIPNCIEFVTESDAKVAFLWIIGEYGHEIEEAPYILEYYVNNLKDTQENLKYKHMLLSAAAKVFIKRPPETYETFANLVNQILNSDTEDVDLKDRCAFYLRVMQANIEEFKKFILKPNQSIEQFVEDEELTKEKGTYEFNTLSVIYNKPPSKFTKPLEYFINLRNKEMLADLKANEPEEGAEVDQAASPTKQPANGDNNLIDIGGQNSPQAGEEGPMMAPENFVEYFKLEAELFQGKWAELNESGTLNKPLRNPNPNMQTVESAFAEYRLFCIASGEMESQMKFYFYGRETSTQALILSEVLLDCGARQVVVSIKAEIEEMTPHVARYISSILQSQALI